MIISIAIANKAPKTPIVLTIGIPSSALLPLTKRISESEQSNNNY